MELRDIETFLKVADELHFGRAAQRLYVSRGRVSQTVRALEREVGAPLFVRSTRQVRLTPLGERFRVGAQRGFDELDRALKDAQAAARSVDKLLRIGYLSYVDGTLVVRLAEAFEESHPGHRVVITAMSTGMGFSALHEDHIDILLAWSPGGSTDAVSGDGRMVGPILARDGRAVLVSARHPLANLRKASIEDVADHETLALHRDAPPSLLDSWTPRSSPSGKPIIRASNGFGSILGRGPISLVDLLTAVACENLTHLTIRSLLGNRPYPGVTLVPVSDMLPCFLVPLWLKSSENAMVRAFAQVAARIAPMSLIDVVPEGSLTKKVHGANAASVRN